MDKKISVIVPVYNSQDTIDRCVESLVNQTYKNIEIILIENGSTDDTLNLCKQWAEKDERVKVAVSEKGVSRARNLGLEMMSGEYFAFVDSDDYVDVTTYEKCLNTAEKENADMTFYLTNSECAGKITPVPEKNLIDLVENKNIKYFFCNGADYVRSGTIRTLFLADKFRHIKYDVEMSCGEDCLYNIECLDISEKRAIVDDYLYYNVNFFNIPHNFAKKYIGRYNFFGSRQILIEKSQTYIEKYCDPSVVGAVKFSYLVQYVNAILVAGKKKQLKELYANSFWKDAHTKENYKNYMNMLNRDCGTASKIQTYLIYHKMYFLYKLAMKIYELKK